MNKQAPSVGRILIMVGFALSCFGLLLFLWLAFGGPIPLQPKGYRFQTSFGEATQLAKEADVRISGVSVGKVKTIEPDKATGRSTAVIELKPRYAPLPKDARAVLRQKTLLGETYVELTPGNGKQAGWVKENGMLPASQVSPTVELDEIFRAFDPKTRAAFQSWMQTQAQALNGRGRDINAALGNLAPFAEDTTTVLQLLQSQSDAVRRLFRNTGTVFDALSTRQGQLASLIKNSNRVFDTTARRNEDLKATFRALPTFNREGRLTVDRLTNFARLTNPLVNQLRPAARELSPTLTDLGLLAPDLKALFRDIGPVIDASRAGLPATRKFLDELRPVLGEFDPTLTQLNPIVDFIGRYKRELNSFFANVTASTQATTTEVGVKGRVHYLRTTNPLNLENLAVYPRRISTNRPNPYQQPGAYADLANGLKVYEDRHCNNAPLPVFATGGSQVLSLLGPTLSSQLSKVLSAATATAISGAAPPCKKQAPFTVQGKTSQFPQVGPSVQGAPERAVPAK